MFVGFIGRETASVWSQLLGTTNFRDVFFQPHIFYTFCALVIMALAITESFSKKRLSSVRSQSSSVAAAAGDGASAMQQEARGTENLMRRVDECRRGLQKLQAADDEYKNKLAARKSWNAGSTPASRLTTNKKAVIQQVKQLTHVRRHFTNKREKKMFYKNQIYETERQTDTDDNSTDVDMDQEICKGSSSTDAVAPHSRASIVEYLETPFQDIEESDTSIYK